MATFEIAFLGTGSPLPNPDRCGAGQVVIAGDAHVMVDCGWGAARRLVPAERRQRNERNAAEAGLWTGLSPDRQAEQVRRLLRAGCGTRQVPAERTGGNAAELSLPGRNGLTRGLLPARDVRSEHDRHAAQLSSDLPVRNRQSERVVRARAGAENTAAR